MPQPVDLTTCDREPIHTPGSIQPHGCLLACDISGNRILRHSDNAERFLGLTTGCPAGKEIADVLPPTVVHDLRNALANTTAPARPSVLLDYRLFPEGPLFDIAVHRHDGHSVIEFEVAATPNADPLDLARTLIARTRTLTTLEDLARQVPRYIQALLGYDRVMMYKFAADGSGKVIGEAKRPKLESFLGQHFPASDIPQQARALYLKNTLRIISDSGGARSDIVPEYDASGAPLDLSYAHLRSVSPIHLEYLRNMGVAASMSLSIVVADKLWGLIACHHYAPKPLPMAQRIATEMFGDFFSLHFASLYHRHRYEATLRSRQRFDALMSDLTHQDTVEAYLREHLNDIAQLVPSDGVGLWMNGVWTARGSTPPSSAIPALASAIRIEDPSGVWATHALSERLAAAADYAAAASGVLAVPLSQLPRDYLFFFRKEQIQTLNWAGDPQKTYESGPHGDRLTPRKSFAIWKQQVERQSPAWTDEDRHLAGAVQVGLREVILRQSEVLASERRQAEIRQRVLNEELNHRVKNILALIKSLINHHAEKGVTLEQYIASLKGRIMALAYAHDQVIRSDGGGSLRQLLGAELSPYASVQFNLDGEDVGLDPRAYSVLALVLHELATNAAKYGALSVTTGRVNVVWQLNRDGDCEMEWRESGGPPVRAPTSKGFGSVLLHRSIPFDLNGTSDVDYRRDGVCARFSIPAKFLTREISKPSQPRESHSPPAAAVGSDAGSTGVSGRNILLVEDQLVIALDAEDMLSRIGAARIDTAASAEEALKLLIASPPDIAVLDVNLDGGTSIVVADELLIRSIPFVFATGYGDTAFIPQRLGRTPIVRKPYSAEALKIALLRALSVAPN